jgi:hypothetical protein
MHDGRRRLAVTGGRLGGLVLAVVTGWIAITSAGGAHAVGAQLVGAPAVAATTTPPAVSPAAAARTATSPRRPGSAAQAGRLRNPLSPRGVSTTRVSRDLVRTPVDPRRTKHTVRR